MASARKRARPPLLDAKGWVPKRPKREAATWVGRDGARREQRFERCILNATMAAVCPPSHSAATPANVSAQDRRRLLPAGAKYDPVQLSGRDAKAVGAVVAKLLKKVVANVEKEIDDHVRLTVRERLAEVVSEVEVRNPPPDRFPCPAYDAAAALQQIVEELPEDGPTANPQYAFYAKLLCLAQADLTAHYARLYYELDRLYNEAFRAGGKSFLGDLELRLTKFECAGPLLAMNTTLRQRLGRESVMNYGK